MRAFATATDRGDSPGSHALSDRLLQRGGGARASHTVFAPAVLLHRHRRRAPAGSQDVWGREVRSRMQPIRHTCERLRSPTPDIGSLARGNPYVASRRIAPTTALRPSARGCCPARYPAAFSGCRPSAGSALRRASAAIALCHRPVHHRVTERFHHSQQEGSTPPPSGDANDPPVETVIGRYAERFISTPLEFPNANRRGTG